MMNKLVKGLAVLCTLLVSSLAVADEAEIKQLKEALGKKMPGLDITSITETPIPGVLELLSGGDIYYLTPDAKFMMQGALIDLEKQVNLTNQRRGSVHIGMINSMPEEKMLIFGPQDAENARAITVFTDTSCPYCSKLHEEIDKLTDAGIKVRYLLYPRAGVDSEAYRELQSVWCADDQQAAMTAAKKREAIEPRECVNPILEHIDLAREVGLRGTPLIYLDSGEIVNGYRPADQLVQLVKASQAVE